MLIVCSAAIVILTAANVIAVNVIAVGIAVMIYAVRFVFIVRLMIAGCSVSYGTC